MLRFVRQRNKFQSDDRSSSDEGSSSSVWASLDRMLSFLHIGENFDEIYFPDGVDRVNGTINGRVKDESGAGNKTGESLEEESNRVYTESYYARITSFLGLPNRKLPGYFDGEDDDDAFGKFGNLWRNFIGWQPDRSLWKLVFNALFMVPLNFVSTLLKFSLNVVKLITEFLPLFIADNLWRAGTSLLEWSNELFRLFWEQGASNILDFIFIVVVGSIAFLIGGLLTLIGGAVGTAYVFVGRAITSPINNVREMWEAGNQLVLEKTAWVRYLFGAIFASLAILSSIVIYSLGFPLLVNLIPATAPSTVMSFLTQFLPATVIHTINLATNTVMPYLTTFGQSLLSQTYMGEFITYFFSVAGLTLAPAGVALGYVIGGAVALIGVPANFIIENSRNTWVDKPESPSCCSGVRVKVGSDSYNRTHSMTTNAASLPLSTVGADLYYKLEDQDGLNDWGKAVSGDPLQPGVVYYQLAQAEGDIPRCVQDRAVANTSSFHGSSFYPVSIANRLSQQAPEKGQPLGDAQNWGNGGSVNLLMGGVPLTMHFQQPQTQPQTQTHPNGSQAHQSIPTII